MARILCLLGVLWVALASGQTAPALEWENDGFAWQLYRGPETWQQAEDWCRAVGNGWHLASLTTPQQFDYTKQQLLSASWNRTVFTTGNAMLLGCGEEVGNKYNLVWIGLHDPSSANAQGDTWKGVASKFEWSDGTQSPYLASGAEKYFAGNASEAEYCIGFSFCSLGTGADKPSVTLTKHPCDWAMSFLCKGPPRKAPAGPPPRDANGSTAPAIAPASNSSAQPTGCQPGTVCAAIVGPVVSVVGAIAVAFLGYLGVRYASRHPKPSGESSPSKSAPAAPASHIINFSPMIQVHGSGGVSKMKAPHDTRPMAAQGTSTL